MITVEIDKKSEAAFKHNLQKLIALSKEPIEEIMRDQARLMCRDLAFNTQRVGKDKLIGENHKISISKKINSIYQDARKSIPWVHRNWGERASLRLTKHINAGDLAKVQRMFDGIYGGKGRIKVIKWDGGKAHERWKKSPKRKVRVILLDDHKKKEKYIKKQMLNVGEAKSGWAKAANMIGGVKNPTKGIPGFAKKKNHRTKGYGSVKGTGAKTTVTLRNMAKYGMNKAAMNKAVDFRIDQVQLIIEKTIKANQREISKASRQGRKAGNAIKKFI